MTNESSKSPVLCWNMVIEPNVLGITIRKRDKYKIDLPHQKSGNSRLYINIAYSPILFGHLES